jgi:hypothetical protein
VCLNTKGVPCSVAHVEYFNYIFLSQVMSLNLEAAYPLPKRRRLNTSPMLIIFWPFKY